MKQKRLISKNLSFLINSFNDDLAGVVLEGSSRSTKTYSSIDFIIHICSIFDEPLIFNIVKETYNSFKTTLYDDFSKRLSTYGLDNPFTRSKEIHSFKIWNHQINFLGADDEAKFHGASCDFLWANEGLDVSKEVWDQAEMRCRRFFWIDYNPKVTIHYIYDTIIPRKDVGFLITTFLDNPYISKSELRKILSYEPTHPEDRHLPEGKRRPHPTNIKEGTADDYMWNVYGLGKRMARTGLIYRNVTWIDSFPDDIEEIGYGLDFGYTNHPSAFVKAGRNGNNLYLELLIYESTENPTILGNLIRHVRKDNFPIWADSADPLFISELTQSGITTYAIKKFPGSVNYGIGLIKSYNLHIVKNRNFQREQENYQWKTINGIAVDEPVKAFDDAWDASRYIVLAKFRR